MKFFVIPDIHGRLDMLEVILRDWNRKEEQLVLLGDYIDYGDNGKHVLGEVKHLVEEYGAIALSGNHDYVVSGLINEKDIQLGDYGEFYEFGRKSTFESFVGKNSVENDSINLVKKKIRDQNPDIVRFLNELKLYHESKDFIFVHAGVDPLETDWKNTKKTDFMWIREPFINGINRTGKKVIFGHERTGMIRGKKQGKTREELLKSLTLDDRVWISECGTKLGIDGGSVFGGKMHAVHLEDGSKTIKVTTLDQELNMTYSEEQFSTMDD